MTFTMSHQGLLVKFVLVSLCSVFGHAMCPSNNKLPFPGPPPFPDMDAIFSRMLSVDASLRALHARLKDNCSAFNCPSQAFTSVSDFNTQRCDLRNNIEDTCRLTTESPTTKAPTTKERTTTTTTTTTSTSTTTTHTTLTSRLDTSSTTVSTSGSSSRSSRGFSTTSPTATVPFENTSVSSEDNTTLGPPVVPPQPLTGKDNSYLYIILGCVGGVLITVLLVALLFGCIRCSGSRRTPLKRQRSDMVPITDDCYSISSTPATPQKIIVTLDKRKHKSDSPNATLRVLHHDRALNIGGFGESSTDKTLERKAAKKSEKNNNGKIGQRNGSPGSSSGSPGSSSKHDDTLPRSTMKAGQSYVTVNNSYPHSREVSVDATSVDHLISSTNSPAISAKEGQGSEAAKQTKAGVETGNSDSLVTLETIDMFSYPAPPEGFQDSSRCGSVQDLSEKGLSVAKEQSSHGKTDSQGKDGIVNHGYLAENEIKQEVQDEKNIKEFGLDVITPNGHLPGSKVNTPHEELPVVSLINEQVKSHAYSLKPAQNGIVNVVFQNSSEDSLTKVGFVQPSVRDLRGKFEVQASHNDKYNSLPNLKKQRAKANQDKLFKKWRPLEENNTCDYATLPKKRQETVNGHLPNGFVKHDSDDNLGMAGTKPAARVTPFEHHPSGASDVHL